MIKKIKINDETIIIKTKDIVKIEHSNIELIPFCIILNDDKKLYLYGEKKRN